MQTNSQVRFVRDFEQHLAALRLTFLTGAKNEIPFTLKEYVMRQRRYLHGTIRQEFGFTPRVAPPSIA